VQGSGLRVQSLGRSNDEPPLDMPACPPGRGNFIEVRCNAEIPRLLLNRLVTIEPRQLIHSSKWRGTSAGNHATIVAAASHVGLECRV